MFTLPPHLLSSLFLFKFSCVCGSTVWKPEGNFNINLWSTLFWTCLVSCSEHQANWPSPCGNTEIVRCMLLHQTLCGFCRSKLMSHVLHLLGRRFIHWASPEISARIVGAHNHSAIFPAPFPAFSLPKTILELKKKSALWLSLRLLSVRYTSSI